MPQRSHIIIGIGLVVITTATFFPVANLGFIGYDDPSYVTANKIVQRGLTAEGLKWAFAELHGAQTYYHPVTWLTHMLDCQLFGMKPRGHHLVSLGFHIANVLLLFWLFSQCLKGETGWDAALRRQSSADAAAQRPYLWASGLIAALFAVHPLQVESVAWVTERKNLVSTFFALLTLLAYLRYTKQGLWRWYAGAIVVFILAVLSKPAVVIVPCLMLLVDYWPLRRMRLFEEGGRFAANVWGYRKLFFEKLPFFAISIGASVVTMQAHRALGMVGTDTEPPTGLKYGNVLLAYFDYVRTFVWPTNLAIYYPFPMSISSASILIALTVLGGVTSGAFLWGKRRPYLLVGWFWFLGALVPMSGVVSVGIQARADRFMYVPIIGLAIMVAFGLAEFVRATRRAREDARPTGHRVFVIAAVPVAVLCVLVSAAQLKYWKDDFTLFDHARRVTKDNFLAYHVIGTTLAQRGALKEALTNLQTCVGMQPMYGEGWLSLGEIKLALGQRAEAVKDLEEARKRGVPYDAQTHLRLGRAYQGTGDADSAASNFKEALNLSPDSGEAHRALGAVLLSQSKFRQAIEEFRQTVALEPNSDYALANLAFLLATHGDPSVRNGQQAVEFAQRACNLTDYAQAGPLNALAAAYAEVGNLDLATSTSRKALEIARSKNQQNIIPPTEMFLRTYEAGKPYRLGSD